MPGGSCLSGGSCLPGGSCLLDVYTNNQIGYYCIIYYCIIYLITLLPPFCGGNSYLKLPLGFYNSYNLKPLVLERKTHTKCKLRTFYTHTEVTVHMNLCLNHGKKIFF